MSSSYSTLRHLGITVDHAWLLILTFRDASLNPVRLAARSDMAFNCDATSTIY